MDWNDSWFWLGFGLLGQAAFASRFLIQWIASERAGRSTFPMAFWYLSLVGSMILLIYAFHRMEPVFLLAYLPNAFIYTRNIILIRRGERDVDSPPASHGPQTAPSSSVAPREP